MKKQGFTLIELLVVVAIIGILATVVLASLNSARTKAADAKIKAQLQSVHPAALMFYDAGSTYTNLCADASVAAMVTSAGATCTATATQFAVQKVLSGTQGTWCVDSTGFTGLLTGTFAAATPKCTN